MTDNANVLQQQLHSENKSLHIPLHKEGKKTQNQT